VISDFTITAAPTSGGSGSAGSGPPTQTAAPGGTASYTLNVGPAAGVFPLPVTLSVSGLPPGATATLNPSTLPAGSSLTHVTLTIQLAPQTGQLGQRGPFGGLVSSVLLGLIVLPFSFRGFRKVCGSHMLVWLLFAGTTGILGVMGCGRDSGFFVQPPHTYTVTITAVSGTVSHATVVLLTVQ
jgi:hypothetical protein